MNRFRSAIALCLLAIPAIARAEDWRDQVPEGWLAAVEVRDLEAFDAVQRRLLGSESSFAVVPVAKMVFGPIADRPWALVAVSAAEEGAPPVPVVLVPADDFDGLCDALGAERAEDLAVFTAWGEWAVTQQGAWAAITRLDSADLFNAPKQSPPRLVEGANSTAVFSPDGLSWLAAEAARREPSKPRRTSARRLPTTAMQVADWLIRNEPVLRALARYERPFAFGLSGSDPDSLRLTVAWDLPLSALAEESRVAPPRAGDDIAALSFGLPVAQPLVDLALAMVESTSDQLVEVDRFPDPSWNAFAMAVRKFAMRADSPALRLTSPGEGDPIAANLSATFAWGYEPERLGDHLLELVTKWNRLMEATRARSPITAEMTPLPEQGGWRLEIDAIGLGQREPLPAERTILKRFYGHETGARIDVVPTGDGRWLATFGSSANPPQASHEGDTIEALAAGELRVDRWAAWERRLEASVTGRKPDVRPLRAERPGDLRLLVRDGRFVLEATLPWEAAEALSRSMSKAK